MLIFPNFPTSGTASVATTIFSRTTSQQRVSDFSISAWKLRRSISVHDRRIQ